jgi:hypothetical protein
MVLQLMRRRCGLAERGRDLIVALQVLLRWGNAANR